MIVSLTLTSMDHQTSNSKLHTTIYNNIHLQNHNEFLGRKQKLILRELMCICMHVRIT